MQRIAILASGNGSNAENIISFFKHKRNVEISLIVSNNENAFVLERAKRNHVPSVCLDKDLFTKGEQLLKVLDQYQIGFIVLAGFLLKIPKKIIEAYPNKILNIHPALLPKYGGKGMYGMHVHKAIIENKEKETGISIHFVNEEYDEGDIVFQAKCLVGKDDTAESLAKKIHQLEYVYFPEIIEKTLYKL